MTTQVAAAAASTQQTDPAPISTPDPNAAGSATADGAGGQDDGSDVLTSHPGYQRMRADMLKEKAARKALEEQAEKRRVEELKGQQRWQELAEEAERKAQLAEEKAKKLETSLVIDRKNQVVREAAIKAGIRREALADLDLIDLEDVTIETTSTGRVNVIGADRAVKTLKTLRPHWFTNPAPSVNPETPGVSSASSSLISVKDVLAAETQAKKTGDKTAYHALLKAYQAQKRANGTG